MKRAFILLYSAISLLCFTQLINAQGTTAFTYQGRLNDTGSPASGNYDLSFALYSVSSGGSPIAPVITNSPTFVTNGLFATNLDFGSVFTGPSRWLEVRVRPFGSVLAYNILTPRQQLTPTPYALFAGSSSNSVTATTVTGSIPSSGLSGGYTNNVTFNGASNSFTGYFSGNGAGLTNVPGGFLTWRIFDSTNLLALANTGYILTSSNFVAVTLPDTTNISDLVRIAAVGTGGWKVSCRTNQSFFVNNLTGAIGLSWDLTAISSSWNSIASSADGTKLLAVDAGNAYISEDSGNSWTLSQSGPTWVSAASSADGSRLVAGERTAGKIWTLNTAEGTWIARGSVGGYWPSVASSADGKRLAGCLYNGQIYTSTDYGTNWIARDSSRTWFSIASSSDGMKLVAAVTNGFIYTSVNGGTNWTQRAASRNWHGVASSANGTRLAACVFNGQIWTSTDSGVNWTARESTRNWSSIASSADGTKLAAAVYGGGVYASGDAGNSWTTHSPSSNWWTVASSAVGTQIVGGVRPGNIYVSGPNVNVTANGFITGGQGSAIELLSVGGGQFVPISFMGQIFAY